MTDTLLSARDIEFSIPTGETLLQRTSLQLNPGQRVALRGPSGSGKSLLLRGLVCLNAGQTGEVCWLGKSITADIPRFRSQCIYVPQMSRVVANSVREFLTDPMQLSVHRQRRFHEDLISEWLNSFGRTESFLDQQPSSLSGGEQQIALLLRTLQLEPRVLLLDEPTSAMDATTTETAESLVTQWLQQQSGRALIWISHNAEQADCVGDTQWSMHAGKLSMEASA